MFHWPREYKVWNSDEKEYISIHETEFLNVEEGPQGEDIVTYSYKGKEYKGRVIG